MIVKILCKVNKGKYLHNVICVYDVLYTYNNIKDKGEQKSRLCCIR